MSTKSQKPVGTPWGEPPKGAETWQLHRREQAGWERCRFFNTETGTAEGEWPLAVLSPEVVKRHWGAGEYALQWIGTKEGKRRSLGKSAVFVFDGLPSKPLYPNRPAADEAPAAPPVTVLAGPAPPLGSAQMQDFIVMYRMVGESHEKLFALQAQSHAAELERAREHHRQTLELMRAQDKPGEGARSDRVLALLVKEIRDLKSAVGNGQDEGEDEEEEAKPQTAIEGLSEEGLALLKKAVSKYGEPLLKKMVEKFMGEEE